MKTPDPFTYYLQQRNELIHALRLTTFPPEEESIRAIIHNLDQTFIETTAKNLTINKQIL